MLANSQCLDNILLTATDAARLIGKSRRWVSKLVAAGFVRRGEDGRFRPDDVAQDALAFAADEKRRSSKAAASAALQMARAREIELRIAREDHRIVDLDEVLGATDEVLGNVKADLDGLGACVTRDAALRNAIGAKIDEIFGRAASRLEQKARHLCETGKAA
jgi:hypothetical protein